MLDICGLVGMFASALGSHSDERSAISIKSKAAAAKPLGHQPGACGVPNNEKRGLGVTLRHPRLRRRYVIALTCALLVLAPPMAAFAHLPQLTYASGTNGAGGTFETGWNHRDYNQVWHQPGREWGVWCFHTDNSYTGIRINTSNPTKWEFETSYAKSQCHNYDDMSGVTWTCQTTG